MPYAFSRSLQAAATLAALLLATPLVQAAKTLSAPSGELTWQDDGSVQITRSGATIIDLQQIRFDYHAPLSVKLIDANDHSIRVALSFPAAVDFRSRATEPLDIELTMSRHGDGFRFYADAEWGNQVTLDLADTGDHVFGLSSPLQPENRHSPDLRESSVTVEVTNAAQTMVENFASAFSSFYISSHGYGAFFDTFGAGQYDFAINGRHKIHHETGTLDWYVFFGDDGRAIHQAYYELIGAPKSLPLWAVGPVGWRDQNDGGAAEILDDLQRFEDLRLPFTSWFVDRPYSDGANEWSLMNFNAKFAKPEEWISTIREDHGIEFMTWTATAFFGDTPMPKHLPGGFTYADLSDPATVALYQQKLTELQHSVGVKGHKMDRADEHLPNWEKWADETVAIGERRNKYAYLFAKTHDESLRRTWGDDQFTFSRAAIHRAQPYLSAIWGGDPRTSWQGLQGNAANAMRASFMGFPVWGTDVGGYLGPGYIDTDLYLRWTQFGIFNGLLEIKFDGSGGDGPDRMPWSYDKTFQSDFRELLELRMALLPYLHSLANTSATNGPLMQPLAYRHLDDPNTYDIWDQYYVGDGLLVAPVLTPGTAREVYLPAGKWYRFDFAEGVQSAHEGQRAMGVQAALDEIPLFVRANSLMVTGDIYRGNSRNWLEGEANTLVIHAFPGGIGEQTSFTYIDSKDDNKPKTITLTRTDESVKVVAPELTQEVTIEVYLDGKKQVKTVPAGAPLEATF
ncbi:glycoside hydrolase family 31 protein [Pelagicoccus sp. NFK12]|uniref:Glycoside hydrolase family 31 protein n=1 Tax=Pelagicoccus enzymogenes TaxID=2773457 RepID=A0A927FCS3_9BACT|nr:glycoside hydrolase family 31 protein [Pelagicoccus enzymogenes]MBD5782469.1 glycoside hydrolase family 31 protein [Pelagicoccus enzymogenes]